MPSEIGRNPGWSLEEFVALRFSRAQLGTHPGCFEGISGMFQRVLKERNHLTDAGHDRIEKRTATTIIQVEIVSRAGT